MGNTNGEVIPIPESAMERIVALTRTANDLIAKAEVAEANAKAARAYADGAVAARAESERALALGMGLDPTTHELTDLGFRRRDNTSPQPVGDNTTNEVT